MTTANAADLPGYLRSAGVRAGQLATWAGLSRAVLSRHLNGVRPMGELAAIKVEQAMRDAFRRGDVAIPPLTREQLCPKLGRRVA